MFRFDDIAARRRASHRALQRLGSKVYAGFLGMERAAFADGALPRRDKELIAVGISVVRDCESCMQWHIGQAVACGAGWREILEAVEVGIEMGGGPATVSARFALEVMGRHFPEVRDALGESSTDPDAPPADAAP